jgi:hypothetical protein
MSRALSWPPCIASIPYEAGSVFRFGSNVALLEDKDAEPNLTVKLTDGLDIRNEE